MVNRYKKIKFWMLATGLSLVCSGLSAGASSEFILDNEGKYCSSNGNFALSVSGNGAIKIYGKGKELGYWAVMLYLNGKWTSAQSFENPIVKIDKEQGRITINSSFNLSGEGKLFYSQQTQAKEGGIELTVSLSGSAGVNLADYIGGPISHVTLKGDDYAGGSWTAEKLDKAGEIPEIAECGQLFSSGGEETVSVFQPNSAIGFAIRNAKENIMTLEDARGDHLAFFVCLDKNPGKYTARQVFMPVYRTAQEIQRGRLAAKTRISFPAAKERKGYFPSGYSLSAEVTIPPAKETAGSYMAEFLLLDQTDREVMKKEMAFNVTEKEAGRAKLDFVTPDQCALYWMRVNVRDKNGILPCSKEYPFAVIMKLPDIKDIPATSPLGGQPIAGKYMPEGRLVGMKWDRFWTGDQTNWKDIEPEKGKFNWEKADKMVDEAIKAGNEILWCLCRPPDWASRLPSDKIFDAIRAKYPVNPVVLKQYLAGTYQGKRISSLFPPRDIKDWEDFVRAIVRRYKTKVHYWQVWNEPWWERDRLGKPVGGVILQLYMEKDLVVGVDPWGFGGSIEDYAELVKATSRIVHEEDPADKVVAYGDYVDRNPAETERFYATGVGDYIDILCMHYFFYEYCCPKKSLPSWDVIGTGLKKRPASITVDDNIIRDFKRIHFKYTGKHVPVWNTEEGWFKCSDNGRISPRPLTREECDKLYGEKVYTWWKGMMSERQNACWEIESHLYSLALGMDKIFLHCGHGISVRGASSSADFKEPTEKGISLAAMASVVTTMKSVDYAPMGRDILDAVTVTDISGKKTAVIWSHTGERKVQVRIPVGKNKKFKGLDFLGNPVAMKSEKGWLTIDVCEEPFYIHDLDLGGIFAGARSFLSIKGEKDIEAIEIGKSYCGEIIVGNPYAGRGIDGVLEASVKPAGKITIEGKVKLAPGEQKTVPFNIVVEGGEEVQVEFVLEDQGAELGRLKKTYSIARYQKGTPLPKCPQVMKVDGEAGDWEGIAEYKVDTSGRVLVGLEMPVYEQAPVRIWKGADDLSFTVRSCWREDGLYFLVDVKDNEITPGPEPSCQWDCVEFFVDARDAAGQSKKEKTPGAVQFSVQPSLGDVPRECKVAFAGNDGKYAKALFMGRKTKTGYMVEGRVEPVGIQLKEGALIGLDVAVDDGREPNPENVGERKSQMVWLGTQDNYKDTSKWGKFYLGR